MTPAEKQALLHQLASLLQDNLGNRITHVLINGLCTTLDAIVPTTAADPLAADALQTGGPT